MWLGRAARHKHHCVSSVKTTKLRPVQKNKLISNLDKWNKTKKTSITY